MNRKPRRPKPPDLPPTLTHAALELYAASRAAHDAVGLEAICAAHRAWVIAQTAFDRAVEAELRERERDTTRREEREASR